MAYPVTNAIADEQEAERELAFVVRDFERSGLIEGIDWGWRWGQPHKKWPEGWYIARYDLKKVQDRVVSIRKVSTSRHRNVKVYE